MHCSRGQFRSPQDVLLVSHWVERLALSSLFLVRMHEAEGFGQEWLLLRAGHRVAASMSFPALSNRIIKVCSPRFAAAYTPPKAKKRLYELGLPMKATIEPLGFWIGKS